MLKRLKKYRAVAVIATCLIFNLIESIFFAAEGHPFNLKPLSIGEWICDIISYLIAIFGLMVGWYDVLRFKPTRVRIYTNLNAKPEDIPAEDIKPENVDRIEVIE